MERFRDFYGFLRFCSKKCKMLWKGFVIFMGFLRFYSKIAKNRKNHETFP